MSDPTYPAHEDYETESPHKAAEAPPGTQSSGNRLASGLGIVQGVFWFLTGVWPLVHLEGFLSLTGPKTDLWLVESFGILVAALGVALVPASLRNSSGTHIWLALAGALAIGVFEIVCVVRDRISGIYLVDAAVELAFALGWTLVLLNSADIEDGGAQAKSR